MKLIYLGKEKYSNRLKSVFKSNSIETVHYKNPLKAIDNLNEIEPAFLYMVKDDFPRFWKIVLSGVRENFNINDVKFYLQGKMDEDESEAFNYLKGSAHFENIDDFINLFKELKSETINTNTSNRVYYPEEREINLGFVKQDDYSFVNCNITEMTEKELILKPENIDDISGIKVGDIINDASLSAGDIVVNINIKVINIEESILCTILNDDNSYLELINQLFV